MKGKNLRVAERGRAYLAIHGKYTLSAITVMEVAYGFRRVGHSTVSTSSSGSFRHTKSCRSTRKRRSWRGPSTRTSTRTRGRPIDLGDVMIAAVALRHGPHQAVWAELAKSDMRGRLLKLGIVRTGVYEDVPQWAGGI